MAGDAPVPKREALGRRALLGAALGGLLALRVRTRSAVAQGGPETLRADELQALVRWYEAIVPGASQAGVADFVQEQLRADPPGMSLLQVRHLGWPPPFVTFYREGLAALSAVSQERAGVSFAELPGRDLARLVDDAARTRIEGWPDSLPLGLWYSGTRADAVDVVYGDQQDLADGAMIQVPAPRW